MLLLGTDIEHISRIRRKMKSTPRFIEKLFTAREREYCDRYAQSAGHYAARFCAKEAFRKAVQQAVDWLDIEVLNELSGQPAIRLHRKARETVAGCSIAVSLSHAGDYATATVMIWKDADPGTPGAV
jgi:holo-[acyl-carrier protein] synthase